MDRILSATFQKDHARRTAFHQWELEYKAARTRNTNHLKSYGSPLDGAAYQYAISQPPSEVNHPLWSAAVALEKDERGQKTRRPLFTRRTTSTVFQLAVDHTFTGSYATQIQTQRPLPHHLRCPCGFHLHNPDHLIRHCRFHYLHLPIQPNHLTRSHSLLKNTLFPLGQTFTPTTLFCPTITCCHASF
jgi:hypothetical protein